MDPRLFGERLKREREMRGVSLEEISAATRISVRFLEALEREQWDRLPGGIFNRGFIRSIARFLGLDEEGLIAEYALETRERPEIAVWTKEPVHPRPNWAAIIGVIVLVAALGTGGWFVHQRYGASIHAWHQNHPVFKSLWAFFNPPKSASPLEESSSSAAAAPVQAPGQAPATSTPSSPATGTAPVEQPAQKAQAVNANGATASDSAPPNTASPAIPLELKVEAGETSNVTVIADGKTVFSGRLEAFRTLSFHAQKSFTISSSKSNAVLLELNGRTVPPLGPPGVPGKVTLTRDTLKSTAGGED